MLFRNIPREKWAKYGTIFMTFGVTCIIFELVMYQHINHTFFGGFFEGLIMGLGTVFNIYGLYLFGKAKRQDLIHPQENMVVEM